MKLLKGIGLALLAVAVLCLIILAMPFFILYIPVAVYKDKKEWKLIEQTLIPKEQYVLLPYLKGSKWEDYIHRQLIPKYGGHIWTKEVDPGSSSFWDDPSLEIDIIKHRVLLNCDCGLQQPIIDHNDLGIVLLTPKGIVTVQEIGEYDAESKPLTKRQLKQKIEETVKAWS